MRNRRIGRERVIERWMERVVDRKYWLKVGAL